MIVQRGYVYRLKPTNEQESLMRQFAGCARFVWNRCLALQKERLDAGEKALKAVELNKILTEWRNAEETAFLADAPCQVEQAAIRFLDRALWDGLKKDKGFPRFKKKGEKEAFTSFQGIKFYDKGVQFPKIGWIRIFQDREPRGVIKNATISLRGDKWYCSIVSETEIQDPEPREENPVGVDVGVAVFAALSSGETIPPLNSFKKLAKRLAIEQRRLSRMVKFSSNWKKQKEKVNRVHERIKNARNWFLHNESTRLTREHGIVVMEDLKISTMVWSAKGTVEEPGKNVSQKSGLNRSILDQGWGYFRGMIKYKMEETGGRLDLVPPQYTSQACSVCGHTDAGNRKTQAQFRCLACGHEENADTNAAKNILRRSTPSMPVESLRTP